MNASGDYYIFVDSDDTISPNMVEEMVKKAKEHDAKIVSSLISEEQDKLGKGNTGKVTVLNTHDALKSIFSDGLVVTSSSGKMYASDLWEDIRFPTDMIFEDFATIYKVIRKAPKVVSFEDWQYFYRPNPAGITGTPFYHRKMQFFDVAAKESEGISDTHPDLVPVIRNRPNQSPLPPKPSFFCSCFFSFLATGVMPPYRFPGQAAGPDPALQTFWKGSRQSKKVLP